MATSLMLVDECVDKNAVQGVLSTTPQSTGIVLAFLAATFVLVFCSSLAAKLQQQ
ncbi:8470_t:CDS:2 [Paraglomus brasilianum]|uniref:8470_t:CDS:1 n=1 Tax=Paraglomus brasilianum TaxID=144538 RepID=A0A9N9BPK4_9GLOM|nr:8470_t:CDS:2 [Paraglomus brasilianum]